MNIIVRTPAFHSFHRSLQHTTIDIINHKPGNGHSEYGRDVDRRAIDLRLRGTPLVVQQVRIPRPILSLGTHTFLRAAALAVPSVRQHLIIIHAEELLGRHRLGPFHLLPQRCPNGHPRTFQNSATLIFSGSTFSAAPSEQKNFALLDVAFKIRCTLSFRESTASIT